MTEPQPDNLGDTTPDETYDLPASPLAAALARVQAKLPRLGKSETGKVSGKNKEGEFFSYEYSYADLASVSRAIMPLLGGEGLAFTSFPTVADRGLVLRYYLLHEAGQMMTGDYPLTGTTAQQIGSSITYARRYCLCAVTGIAPDEDDDAAGADGQREAEADRERREQLEVQSAEYTHAANAVQGAWAATVGAWDQAAAAKAFNTWSKGGSLREADAATLRTFAAYLTSRPQSEAGEAPTGEQPASEPEDTDTRPMSGRQRGQLFVLMGQIGKADKGSQLEWINKTLGTEYESRSSITAGDAKILIDALKQGIDVGIVPGVPATRQEPGQ